MSDRDQGIVAAVAEVWPHVVHYACEQHIAENMAERARKDGTTDPVDPIWPILEDAQFGEKEWAAAEGAAQARSAENLLAWLLAHAQWHQDPRRRQLRVAARPGSNTPESDAAQRPLTAFSGLYTLLVNTAKVCKRARRWTDSRTPTPRTQAGSLPCLQAATRRRLISS